MKNLKLVAPVPSWSIQEERLREMLADRWRSEQQRTAFIVSTRGDTRFLSQALDVPASSFVYLTEFDGTIDAGPQYGGRRVDCRGYYRGSPLDGVANKDCTFPGMN